jgi:hypothetical protein
LVTQKQAVSDHAVVSPCGEVTAASEKYHKAVLQPGVGLLPKKQAALNYACFCLLRSLRLFRFSRSTLLRGVSQVSMGPNDRSTAM